MTSSPAPGKARTSQVSTTAVGPLQCCLNLLKKSSHRTFVLLVVVGVSSILAWSFAPGVSAKSLRLYLRPVLQQAAFPTRTLFSTGPALELQPTCWPVLERASHGRWVPRSGVSEEETAAMDKFIATVRGYERLPLSVQRNDSKCGNVNMAERGAPSGLSWYKAMCDPAGPRSCCYSNHTCVALPVAQCQCDGCQDLRQQIHAEFATWVPYDTACKIKTFKDERDICPILGNMTIHVIGDSFMRQVFISLLATLRSRRPDGIFSDRNISAVQRQRCDEYMKYFSKCSNEIPQSATECDGKVVFRRVSLWRASQISKILKVFEQYVGQPGSYLIFGLGIHDMYHPNVTISKVLKPVLTVMKKKPPWPKMIWVAPQSPGVLKTPLVKQQQKESVAKFNSVVTPYLKSEGVPVLDGFNITLGSVMSYDGTHYGKGLNDLKAQILFNYFGEIRSGVS